MEMILSGFSAFFSFVALGLFAFTIAKKQSRPHLLAWSIRILLVAIAFVSQVAAGATYSLALSGSQLAGGVLIVILIAYRQPRLGRLDRSDWLAIGAATTGATIWMASGNPLFGLLGAMLADTAATAMGIRASIVSGTRDSLAFWVCALVAASMAMLAAGSSSVVVVLAPLFSCFNAGVNIMAMWYVRQRAGRRTSDLVIESA